MFNHKLMQTKLRGIQIEIDEIGNKLFAQNESLGTELKMFAFEVGMIRASLDEALKNTSHNNARDAICPHWETYNRGGSGEFGICNCGGKISSGQTAPVA